jgi:asparagine synthase (glutamine-hydrolysing)
MPDVVGMVSPRPSTDRRDVLARMVGAIVRHSDDRVDTYEHGTIGLTAAWTSHGAEAGRQSVRREDGNGVWILTGELAEGDRFEDYDERGIAAVTDLNGWFVGLAVDLRRQRCYLFNDRFGMSRLFIHERVDGIYFATTAAALLAAFPETRAFDEQGVAEYLVADCTLGSSSIFKGITVLPAGSLWSWDQGRVDRRTYFNRVEWEQQICLTVDSFSEELRALLPAVVRRWQPARRVGVSLTAGLDSRMLMSCLNDAPDTYPCYTFGSMYRDTFDVKIARSVASACHQPHTTFVLGDEFLREFPQYMEEAVIRSSGYLGMSGAAELFLNRQARAVSPIRLTGNYGSELLREARAFKGKLPDWVVGSTHQPALRQAVHTFDQAAATNSVSFALFCQAPHQGFGRRAIESSELSIRSPFLDNDLARLAYRAPLGRQAGTAACVSVIEHHKPRLLAIPTDRGYLGRGNALTRAVRRGHRELLFKSEYLAGHGMPHALAAALSILPGRLPERRLLGYHKFQHFRQWLRSELWAYVRDVLAEPVPEVEVFADRSHLSLMLEDHKAGRSNHFSALDKALTLTITAKKLFASGLSSGEPGHTIIGRARAGETSPRTAAAHGRSLTFNGGGSL